GRRYGGHRSPTWWPTRGVDHPTDGAGVGRSALFRPPIRCAPRHPRHARRPTLRWPRLTPLIQLGFTHRPSLVTAVTPQVLLGRFAELFLHPLVDAQAIRFLALAGEVVQRRMDHQAISRAIRQALLGEGDDPGASEAGELGGGGYRGSGHAEQGHEDALPAAIILIGRVPDGAAGAQHLEHGAHILAFHRGGVLIVALAPAA